MKRANRDALQQLAHDPETKHMVVAWLADLDAKAASALTPRGKKLIDQIATPYRQALAQVKA